MTERVISPVNDQLFWVERFETVAELLETLQAFKERYNHGWLVDKYGHCSPVQARAYLRK